LVGKDDRCRLFSYLENRFGIPRELFDDYLLVERNKVCWLLRASPMTGAAAELKVWTAGLKAFQKVGQYIKPTTRFIQRFGQRATRAIMEIDHQEMLRLAAGEAITVETSLENGYVILTLMGHPLGLGLLIRGTLSSQIPHRELHFLNLP
jgi:NOL1/NOP2/fmu family ribosome biogenesis protein